MIVTINTPVRWKSKNFVVWSLCAGILLLVLFENRAMRFKRYALTAAIRNQFLPPPQRGLLPEKTPPPLQNPSARPETPATPHPERSPVPLDFSKIRRVDPVKVEPHNPPLGVDTKKLDCEAVMLADNKLPHVPSYPVPRECGLGVVAIGMPRAGSSLEVKLTTTLLKTVFSQDRILNFYWDLHKHNKWQSPQSDDHLIEINRLLKGVDEAKVIIAKSHEFIPDLLKLCQKTVVLSVRRNLWLTSNSIMLSGWVKHDAYDDLTALHNLAMNRRACWLSKANLTFEVEYEDFVNNPVIALKEIGEALDLGATAGTVKTAVADVIAGEANAGFPSTKSLTLTTTQLRTILHSMGTPAVARWQAAHGYNFPNLTAGADR